MIDFSKVVNNSDTREEALGKGRLLRTAMTVGKDWEVRVWPVRSAYKPHNVFWRHELRSGSLSVDLYPTTAPHSGEPRFAAGLTGIYDADLQVKVRWEDQKDPNLAVKRIVRAFRERARKEMGELGKVMSSQRAALGE